LNKEEDPEVYTFAKSVVEELKEKNPYYKESDYCLLLTPYIELLRFISVMNPWQIKKQSTA